MFARYECAVVCCILNAMAHRVLKTRATQFWLDLHKCVNEALSSSNQSEGSFSLQQKIFVLIVEKIAFLSKKRILFLIKKKVSFLINTRMCFLIKMEILVLVKNMFFLSKSKISTPRSRKGLFFIVFRTL